MRNKSQLNYWMNDLKKEKKKKQQTKTKTTTYGGANQVIFIDQICDTELL